MDFFPYGFETRIAHHDLGAYRYTVVWLDEEIATELPFEGQPRLRIAGEVAEVLRARRREEREEKKEERGERGDEP